MMYEFWQHRTSGDLYAIAFTESDEGTTVIAVSEPLSHRDIAAQPDPSEYNLADDDADWFQGHTDLFATYEPE